MGKTHTVPASVVASKTDATGITAVPAVETPANPVPEVVASVLQFRRFHPGGGPLGRCSYGIAGVPGIVVFDMGLFAGGIAPQTITINVELAKPMPRKVAGVTSAVVAGANSAQATVAGTAIATPAEVAAVASKVGATVVAAAASKS